MNPNRAIIVCAVFFLLGIAGIFYRLTDLQILRHDHLRDTAQENTIRMLSRTARRGEIRDIRGNLLATSLFVKTVCADPSLIADHYHNIASALAPVLGMEESELRQRLQPKIKLNEKGQVSTNQYVVLKRKVTAQVWKQVEEVMVSVPLPGLDEATTRNQRAAAKRVRQRAIFVDRDEDQMRVYPGRTLAAHVLGFVAGDSHDGIEGLESTYNPQLTGASGWLVTETDSRKRELVALRQQDVAARNGLNLVLTLDTGVQHILETELFESVRKHQPVAACGLVIRPKTGEVLAMANWPNYDPNQPGSFPPESRRNRIVTDVMEPGSTFKVVAIAAALNEKQLKLADRFDCERGHFTYAGKVLHDHHPYGVMSAEQILVKSSNIGTAKIAMQLGQESLYDYIRRFGFGAPTAINFPGEVSGIVHPVKRWNKLSITRVPMGHEVAATPLQLVMMMSAIANEGRMMKPMLVSRLEDEQGRVVMRYHPEMMREVIRPETASTLIQALKKVVTDEGTAKAAQLDYFTVGGKTGTAQKPGPGGYLPGKYFSSFIGFFPANDAQLCIMIGLDEPKGDHYGGQIAGPVFKAVAERSASYLGLKPDIQVKNSIAASTTSAPQRKP